MAETATEKPPRDPTVPCPTCGNVWLFTNYYDKCYACGRNVDAAAPPPGGAG